MEAPVPRRSEFPFRGKRILLDIKNNVVHDLDFEEVECGISSIRSFEILMFDDLESALTHQRVFCGRTDGCYWCLPRHHRT